jgi:endonuclease-3
MELFENTNNWAEKLQPLIAKYKGKKHPLDYENLYQLMVAVILSAQDSDANINKIAPVFLQNFQIWKYYQLQQLKIYFLMLVKLETSIPNQVD